MANKNKIGRKCWILLLQIFLVFLSISCSDDSSPTTPNLTMHEKLQKALDDGIIKYNGKGISVAIIIPDQDMWIGTKGISHESTPITEEMIFSAGSITKTFTACTIMQLAEENKISLSDPISKWISNYKNIDSNITIKQLLNHTNGIYDIADNEQLFEMIFSNPDKILTIEEILSKYVREPNFIRGTGWQYSNTGYLILRMIIRKATNSTIADEYRNRFLTTLNLNRTYLAPEENLISPVAHGWHDLDDDGIEEELYENSMTSFYSLAGGGIFTTAKDLANWANALFHNRTAINPEILEQMTNFYALITNEELLSGYGLGIERFNSELFDGLEIWGHGGDPVGYAAGCFYIPKYGVSIGIMDNTGDGRSMNVIFDVIKILVEAL